MVFRLASTRRVVLRLDNAVNDLIMVSLMSSIVSGAEIYATERK